MTDLPSLLIGAALVVVGNVVISTLTHFYQSNREKRVHLRTAEQERKNRLRVAYTEILRAGFTLQGIPQVDRERIEGETDEEHFKRLYGLIYEVRKDTLQAKIAILLEDNEDTERLYNSLWKWSEHEQTPSVFSRGVKHDHPTRTD